MNKPITMLKDEFYNNLITSINESQMPLFVIEYILKDVLSEVHSTNLRQADEAKRQYEASLNGKNKEVDNNA